MNDIKSTGLDSLLNFKGSYFHLYTRGWYIKYYMKSAEEKKWKEAHEPSENIQFYKFNWYFKFKKLCIRSHSSYYLVSI